MSLDDGPVDRQSHAGSIRLCGVERIENPIARRRQARARIADRNPKSISAV
jgi:hypothetical protein